MIPLWIIVIVMSTQASIIIIPAQQVVQKKAVALAPLSEFIAHEVFVGYGEVAIFYVWKIKRSNKVVNHIKPYIEITVVPSKFIPVKYLQTVLQFCYVCTILHMVIARQLPSK